jgi:2-keto-4-pentenoate hydratase
MAEIDQVIRYEIPQIPLEDQRRYRGQTVAVDMKTGKVLAGHKSSMVAVQEALEAYPDIKEEDIEVAYIPAADYLCL